MSLENSVSVQSKKMTDQKISLFNILTCLLCSSRAKVAHICPTCSKFYCGSCIKAWIERGNHCCVNCKAFINENNIVNCSKFSQEFFNAIERLIPFEQVPTCKVHNIQQTYYCQECKYIICSDCIVLESNHKGHNVTKLQKVKMEFNERILQLLSKIRNNIKYIEKGKEEANSRKNNQNKRMKSKVEELNSHMQKIRSNFQQLINQNMQQFEEILEKKKLQQITKEKIYEQYSEEIKEMPKISLVRQQKQLQQLLQQLIVQSSENLLSKKEIQSITNRDSIISNVITSKFAQQIYVLKNYKQKRQKKETIYSDIFVNGPLAWRLKIYPNGLEKKREISGPARQRLSHSNFGEEYISIYIELVTGVREGGRYRFTIEILNESDQSKVISQVYEADFDTGKCWGYNDFANISTLYQKGYVNLDEDSIKISVSVGPPSYYYSSIDQQAMIVKREQIMSDNQTKIQQLRKKLHIEKPFQEQLNHTQQKQLKIKEEMTCKIKNIQNQTEKILIEDIHTPPNKIQSKSQKKNRIQLEQHFEDPIDFENYIVDEIPKDGVRCNEQLNYQSAELRKFYKRFTHLNEKSNLLLF